MEPCVLQTISQKDFRELLQHSPAAKEATQAHLLKRLERADHLIFIFPIWWDLMPATTKGFIDRVLSPGVVYDHHPRGFGLVPLLKNLKGVTVITTMNKPKIMYSLLFGNLIQKAMIRSVFKTMGYKNLKWISFNRVKSVRQEKRLAWLASLEKRFSALK